MKILSTRLVQLSVAAAMSGAVLFAGTSAAHPASLHQPTAKGPKWATITLGESLSPPKAIEFGPYVALAKGFFRKEHLHVTIDAMPNGLETELGTTTGQMQLGLSASTDIIQSVASGAPLESVWGSLNKLDTECIGGPGIKTVADLRGKTVGIAGAGGFTYVTLQGCLKAGGLTTKDVKVVNLTSRAAFVPALVGGQIQAAVFHVDDGLAAMHANPNLHVLVKEYQTLPHWWLQSMDVQKSWAQTHGGVIERVITALILADRWMYSHKAAVVRIGAKVSGEDPAILSKAYNFLAKAHIWEVNSGFNKKAFLYTAKKMKQYGDITAIPSWHAVANQKYVKAVLKKIGTVNVNKLP